MSSQIKKNEWVFKLLTKRNMFKKKLDVTDHTRFLANDGRDLAGFVAHDSYK